ncbi:MAG: metalloprotease RseP [Pseudomonadota bacterium]|jgi:regulator of sigma E protease
MNFIQTLLAFAVVLGVLVIVHELGHYLVARWCGVKVLRFSVGMGPVIWSRRFGQDQTEWAVSALPLGGYVKMLDAREDDVGELTAQDLQREFTNQTVMKRIAIVLAGPVANFLLAILIFAGLYLHGVPEIVARVTVKPNSWAATAGLKSGDLITAVNTTELKTWSDLRWELMQAVMDKRPAQLAILRPTAAGNQEILQLTLPTTEMATADLDEHLMDKLGLDTAKPKAKFSQIMPDGPAAKAGLQAGDEIVNINGVAVENGIEMVTRLQNSAGQTLTMDGIRAGQAFSVQIKPEAERVGERTVGRIRAQIDTSSELITVSENLPVAIAKGIGKTWDTSAMTLSMLGKMIMGEASLKNITGPITIADYAGQTARTGAISFLSFMAFISISLGVMNLLPIPVLDGGHLLYYSLELLTGRPVSQRVSDIAQRAGVGILMVLMAVAIFNDIARLVS